MSSNRTSCNRIQLATNLSKFRMTAFLSVTLFQAIATKSTTHCFICLCSAYHLLIATRKRSVYQHAWHAECDNTVGRCRCRGPMWAMTNKHWLVLCCVTGVVYGRITTDPDYTRNDILGDSGKARVELEKVLWMELNDGLGNDLDGSGRGKTNIGYPWISLVECVVYIYLKI